MIVKHTQIPHAIRADTTVYTACSIHHIVKNVKQNHKPQPIRINTRAYIEEGAQSDFQEAEDRTEGETFKNKVIKEAFEMQPDENTIKGENKSTSEEGKADKND